MPKKPAIEPMPNGPYMVKDLEDFKNSKGEIIPTTPMMMLCRCGSSSHKPFCDGTHVKVKFNSDKHPNRLHDKMDDYRGKKITIHDNRGVCSHAGHCTDNLPSVFLMRKEPWINPDGAGAKETDQVIRLCPSGALSHTIGNEHYKNQGRSPGITIQKDGPHRVVGGPELKGFKPEAAHYTLCRCGSSKNKPFCDGTHWQVEFKDEKN